MQIIFYCNGFGIKRTVNNGNLVRSSLSILAFLASDTCLQSFTLRRRKTPVREKTENGRERKQEHEREGREAAYISVNTGM